MCKSKKPKITTTTTIARPPVPPEPPPGVELGSKRRREEKGSRSRRMGTAQLRIDLNVPGGGSSGVNMG